MSRKSPAAKAAESDPDAEPTVPAGRPSSLVDTRVIYCGGCLGQLCRLPDGCVDLIDIDPAASLGRATRREPWTRRDPPKADGSPCDRPAPRAAARPGEATLSGLRARRVSRVNSSRNEVFRRGLSEPRPSGSGLDASFEDPDASAQAYIEYMRPRCVELARVLKKTGSFYYHCDWHASHAVHARLRRVGRRQKRPLPATMGEPDLRKKGPWSETATVTIGA
jgi:DNA modification methylase